jgi:hypothetical protein
MGQDVQRRPRLGGEQLLEEREAMPSDGGIRGHVVGAKAQGFRPSYGSAFRGRKRGDASTDAIQGPPEIDGGGPGGQEHFIGGEARVGRIGCHGETQPEGRGGANERSAAHLHDFDRLGARLHCLQGAPNDFVGQQGLVEDLHGTTAGQRLDSVTRHSQDFHTTNSWNEVKRGCVLGGVSRLPGRMARSRCR